MPSRRRRGHRLLGHRMMTDCAGPLCGPKSTRPARSSLVSRNTSTATDPLLFHERLQLDRRTHVGRDRGPRDKAAADFDEPRTGGHALEANAELVDRHLKRRARREPGTVARCRRNNHPPALSMVVRMPQ